MGRRASEVLWHLLHRTVATREKPGHSLCHRDKLLVSLPGQPTELWANAWFSSSATKFWVGLLRSNGQQI